MKKIGWEDPSDTDHAFIYLFSDSKAQLFKHTLLLWFITFTSDWLSENIFFEKLTLTFFSNQSNRIIAEYSESLEMYKEIEKFVTQRCSLKSQHFFLLIFFLFCFFSYIFEIILEILMFCFYNLTFIECLKYYFKLCKCNCWWLHGTSSHLAVINLFLSFVGY